MIREQYRNPWNHIRMGKLVEDFDALAGTVAFKVHFFFFFQIELWVLLVTGLNVLGFHYINETDSKFIFFNGLIQSSRLEQTG